MLINACVCVSVRVRVPCILMKCLHMCESVYAGQDDRDLRRGVRWMRNRSKNACVQNTADACRNSAEIICGDSHEVKTQS